jgi:hypothetical protein
MHSANASCVTMGLPGPSSDRIVPRASTDAQIVAARRTARSATTGLVTNAGSWQQGFV